jgi:chitinase
MRPSSLHFALLYVGICAVGIVAIPPAHAQPSASGFAVIGYVHGDMQQVDSYAVESLTHLNYSFLHLKGNRLAVTPRDSAALAHLVSLRSRNPRLKIIVSLGGWGGCEHCSDVFATAAGRAEFARSALEILHRFNAHGLDLDWEYPAIEGYPGHPYVPADRHNFTLLIKELRTVFGDSLDISFAAGGFPDCLKKSFEWQQIMPLVDRVNIMSYDLVNGNSTRTGHHTPLYSTPDQVESADNAVSFLDALGIPRSKVVVGAAFYARVWQDVADSNYGLYQQGRFQTFIPYKHLKEFLTGQVDWHYRWDSIAQAPYCYSPGEKLFATFDDSTSVARKTSYAIAKKLGGIMFWELTGDTVRAGLLQSITRALIDGRVFLSPPSRE